MTKDEIATAVREIFSDTLKVEQDKLQPEANLKEDLELDSLDMIEVVCEVEDRFDVQIPEDRIKDITTFGQVVDGLYSAIEAKG